MASCQKGPICHAYAWQIRPFWQDTLDICMNELGHHSSRKRLVAISVPWHYLNQCWLVVNWTSGNTFQLNLNQYSIISIQGNEFKNVKCHNAGHFVQGEMSWFGLNQLVWCWQSCMCDKPPPPPPPPPPPHTHTHTHTHTFRVWDEITYPFLNFNGATVEV